MLTLCKTAAYVCPNAGMAGTVRKEHDEAYSLGDLRVDACFVCGVGAQPPSPCHPGSMR